MSGKVMQFNLKLKIPVSNGLVSSFIASDIQVTSENSDQHMDISISPEGVSEFFTPLKTIDIFPPNGEPLVETQRRGQWEPFGGRVHITHLHSFATGFVSAFRLIHKHTLVENRLAIYLTNPYIEVRLMRACLVFLVSWIYHTPPKFLIPHHPRLTGSTYDLHGKRPLEYSLSQVIACLYQTIEAETGIRDIAPYEAAWLVYKLLVERLLKTALMMRRKKFAECCTSFLMDIIAIASIPNAVRPEDEGALTDLTHDLEDTTDAQRHSYLLLTQKESKRQKYCSLIRFSVVPSVFTSAVMILATLKAYAGSGAATSEQLPSIQEGHVEDLHAMVDIPFSAIDLSHGDMFESEQWIHYYLASPARVPLEFFSATPSPNFPLLPQHLDDVTMPNLSSASVASENAKGGLPGVDSSSFKDFIAKGRQAVAYNTRGTAPALTDRVNRSLLPLCVVSALDHASRIGLHNEDRWWLTNFLEDIGSFDMEDMDKFFTNNVKGYDYRQSRHISAHVSRYASVIENKVERGYDPLATVSCMTMSESIKCERSDRRTAYCPFVTRNNTTAQEVRQFLAWQKLNFSEEEVDDIVEKALQGEQNAGCLAHFNAISRAYNAVHSEASGAARNKKITNPPLFVYLQALRRTNNTPVEPVRVAYEEDHHE